MPFSSLLTRRLGLTYPIIQAPMAGGATTADLVGAVSAAGALGSVGAAYLTPAAIADSVRQIRARTDRPFGINLFAPLPVPELPADPGPALDRLRPIHELLGLAPPTIPVRPVDPFESQFVAVLNSGASVFSFTFGIVPSDALQAAKDRGMLVAGTATTVREARALEAAGVDAVIAQGSEAGGHRGTFDGPVAAAMVGTLALVPQVVDAVSVPVIASGGIMDGRGVVAALALGAAAVQMGTAFLCCPESGVPEAHKSAILNAAEDETRLTWAFSGRAARGIVNEFMDSVESGALRDSTESGACKNAVDSILPYPYQNALTRPMRVAAAGQGRGDYLSLWAGQGVRLARRMPAAAMVVGLGAEMDATLRRLSGLA